MSHIARQIFTETYISFSSSSVDVGQTATVAGIGFGASLRITSFTLGDIPLNCTGATVGSCTSGVITTDGSGDFNVTVVAPEVSASGSYALAATDSASTTHHGSITVDLDPTAGTVTASIPSADVGQPVTFRSVVALGSGGYAYEWSGLPGCAGTSDPLRCVPSTAGTTTVALAVTDSNGFLVNASGLSYTVYADPAVSVPNITAEAVDVNQSVTFATSASLGTGTYLSYNWTGLPSGCRGTTSSIRCIPQAPSSGLISVTVTDSNGWVSASSGAIGFTVFADLSLPTPSANRTSADVGQPVEFAIEPSEGSGGYTYVWVGLPDGCTGTDPVNCTVTQAGNLSVLVRVTDSDQFEVTSSPLGFRVYAAPTITLVPARTAVDPGQKFTLSATASDGSGGFTYAWAGLPTGCSGTKATVSCSTHTAGSYSVSVRVTDSNEGSAASNAVALVVASPLAATGIVAVPTAPTPGEAVSFSSQGTGGTGNLSYAWAFGDGTKGSGATVQHSYASAGTFDVALWVNDSVGGSVKKTAQVIVAASPTTGPLGGSAQLGSILTIAVVIVAVLALAALLLRRRRKRSARGEAPDPGPPPDAETEPSSLEAGTGPGP
jgi:hypothetical protein